MPKEQSKSERKKERIESRRMEDAPYKVARVNKNKKQNKSSESLEKKPKLIFGNNFDCSIVCVEKKGNEFDFERPWQKHDQFKCSGSGSVVENNGIKYILTNAHVACGAHHLTVRLKGDFTSYDAKVKFLDAHCDLALLEIIDEDFQKKAKPLGVGNLALRGENIYVAGFPLGGEEFFVSKGVVNRIEYDEFTLVSVRLLSAQVDAIINAGNSGGPVLNSNKEICGVAFQGVSEEQLWYMIPANVVQHFLKGAFEFPTYNGFPELAIYHQEMPSAEARKLLGVPDAETGICVNRVSPFSGAAGILQPGDLIVSVDGYKIHNDGKIMVKDIGRCEYQHPIKEKFIGDKIKMEIYRAGVKKEVEITLKLRANEDLLIKELTFGEEPEFYVNSGMIFQPVTANFLNTISGEELLDYFDIKNGPIDHHLKTEEDKQIIFINKILESDETDGYKDIEMSFVKEVNGQKVKNMVDLIKNLELNPNPIHIINVSDNVQIRIPNLTSARNIEICRACGVNNVYSSHFEKLILDLQKNNHSMQVELMNISKVSPLDKVSSEELSGESYSDSEGSDFTSGSSYSDKSSDSYSSNQSDSVSASISGSQSENDSGEESQSDSESLQKLDVTKEVQDRVFGQVFTPAFFKKMEAKYTSGSKAKHSSKPDVALSQDSDSDDSEAAIENADWIVPDHVSESESDHQVLKPSRHGRKKH